MYNAVQDHLTGCRDYIASGEREYLEKLSGRFLRYWERARSSHDRRVSRLREPVIDLDWRAYLLSGDFSLGRRTRIALDPLSFSSRSNGSRDEGALRRRRRELLRLQLRQVTDYSQSPPNEAELAEEDKENHDACLN